MTYVIYDDTFGGLLTAIFDIYALKVNEPRLRKTSQYSKGLFNQEINVATDIDKCNRVKTKLVKLFGKRGFNDLYRAFLFESAEADDVILSVVTLAIKQNQNILSNFNNPDVLRLRDILKKISRERHRMTAFVRFKESEDGLYVATIEPDFNVLPLIVSHFKHRYADQLWLIYDTQRDYGIYYNLTNVTEVTLTENGDNLPTTTIQLSDREEKFQQLWKDYFKATNVESRRNKKLHLQHVPKRYWKYLIEKQ